MSTINKHVKLTDNPDDIRAWVCKNDACKAKDEITYHWYLPSQYRRMSGTHRSCYTCNKPMTYRPELDKEQV